MTGRNGPLIVMLAVLMVAYVGCYGVARTQHLIVHTQTDDVVAGDGKLASPNPLVAGFFTPLRWMEKATWWTLGRVTGRTGLPR